MACATKTCFRWAAGAERNCKGRWEYLRHQDCGFTDLFSVLNETLIAREKAALRMQKED